MSRTLKFYGESDDLFEIEGYRKGEPDEINCYDSAVVIKVFDPITNEGLYVVGQYAPNDVTACWMMDVMPLDEDIEIPQDWDYSIQLGGRGYSTELTLVVPDTVKLKNMEKDLTEE